MKDEGVFEPKKLSSISKKIFFIMLMFVLVILIITWVLEYFFLDAFYSVSAKNTIKNSLDTIEENIDNVELLPTLVNRIAHTEDLCVTVAQVSGITLTIIADEHLWEGCEIHTRSPKEYYEKARLSQYKSYSEENQGRFLEYIYSETDYLGDVPSEEATPRDSYTSVRIIEDSENNRYVIIVEGAITPIPSMKKTLPYQLTALSLVFILFSYMTVFTLSKAIATPLISLNKAAKFIPSGNADFSVIETDYKEIKELKETLNDVYEELNKIELYRREIIANISHDLRTPLALIKGYSEMMVELPSEASKENIQVIVDEATRLTSLVNDMLDLSRLQEGGDKLRLNVFDIVSTLDDMIKTHGKLIKKQGYNLEWEHEESAYIYADEIKIIQVIYNFINNAVNYAGEDKQVTVRQYTKGENVRVEVIDNGEGIDVEKVQYIWDRYYKSDKSHKRAIVGTGLGLSIVKMVMNMHPGGVYGVITSQGEGSTFYIELPKFDPETMDIDEEFLEE